MCVFQNISTNSNKMFTNGTSMHIDIEAIFTIPRTTSNFKKACRPQQNSFAWFPFFHTISKASMRPPIDFVNIKSSRRAHGMILWYHQQWQK